jgi:hypothetical protein
MRIAKGDSSTMDRRTGILTRMVVLKKTGASKRMTKRPLLRLIVTARSKKRRGGHWAGGKALKPTGSGQEAEDGNHEPKQDEAGHLSDINVPVSDSQGVLALRGCGPSTEPRHPQSLTQKYKAMAKKMGVAFIKVWYSTTRLRTTLRSSRSGPARAAEGNPTIMTMLPGFEELCNDMLTEVHNIARQNRIKTAELEALARDVERCLTKGTAMAPIRE